MIVCETHGTIDMLCFPWLPQCAQWSQAVAILELKKWGWDTAGRPRRSSSFIIFEVKIVVEQ